MLRERRYLGVRNLRVMADGEGPDGAPYRAAPALQPAPGVYNQDVFTGLDVLLAEMGQRGMRAVVCLGNFWQWSGGFAQYVAWAEGSDIPYPPAAGWDAFEAYAGRFYANPLAQAMFLDHVATVVGRVSKVTGLAYRDDPTIMTWQLANEPIAMGHDAAFAAWARASQARIRAIDPVHLITTGNDTPTATPTADDYVIVHIWAQNAGWYDPTQPDDGPRGYVAAKKLALADLQAHAAVAAALDKPLVLEEFGLARDGGSYQPEAPTQHRDDYYAAMFAAVVDAAVQGQALAGANFWAWAGEGRPDQAGGSWRPYAPWLGDPPHEPQGWYSVYDRDASTAAVIRKYSALLGAW